MRSIIYSILGLVSLVPVFASAFVSDFGRDGYGMMGYGYGSGMGTFMVAGGIVWTVVGILAGVWLWQNINKK